jgi:predicted amidohydrolase YtcJ
MSMGPADEIWVNGRVITVDAGFTVTDSVAFGGGVIQAVGPRAAMAAVRGPATIVRDLGGRAVMPGLIDGHAHMDREALKGIYPALGTVRSIRDIQARIRELAAQTRPGEWIVTMPIGDPPFYRDMPGLLAEGRWPTRQELDAAAPEHPVFIRSIWGYWRHTTPLVSCANSRALALAGIDRDTVSPIETLTIERDAAGEPTGVLFEEEMQPIAELTFFRGIPGFTRAQRASVLPQSARFYHRFGTTSVFEEHGAANELLRAYKDARRAGTLTMRATLAVSPNWDVIGDVPYGPLIEAWAGWLGEPALGDDWLKMSGLFVDVGDSAANRLRARAAPYTGWAGFNYNTWLSRPRAMEVLRACAANDIRAVAISPEMLDLYDEIDRETPLAGRRWVFGHIGVLSDVDIERIARMGLVVSTHTNRWIDKSGHLLMPKMPPERHREISPLRSLVEAGVTVSLATDNVPVSLFRPIEQSVSRRSRFSGEVVAGEQALTREQALRAATIGGAYLTFDEERKGSIEVGKLADLVVLDADPLTVEAGRIGDIQADRTVIGGTVVYEREGLTDGG